MGVIKCVREYQFYNDIMYDVIYKDSGRLYMYRKDDLPKTVQAFIVNAMKHPQYDKIFKREEIIYD